MPGFPGPTSFRICIHTMPNAASASPIDLRRRERTEEAVVLRAQELDQETARCPASTRYSPNSQPFGVLVVPVPPQDREHDEAEHRLEELRRVDAKQRVGARARRRLDAEQRLHVAHGGRRRTLGERHRERTAPRTSVVVADRPASGPPDRVAGGDADAGDVADADEVQLLELDRDVARRDRPNEPAPEHEARSADEIADVVRDDERVVQLAADQRPEDRGEDQVGNRRRVVPTTRELALRDDLRDREREQHGDAESREREPANGEGERMDDRRVGHLGGNRESGIESANRRATLTSVHSRNWH